MPRSFWSALKITTSGQVQRHSGFEWLCKHNRLRPKPIRFVRLDSEHAQSNGKSVNGGLPELDLARGRDFQCWPKGSRPLGTRMPSGRRREHAQYVTSLKIYLRPRLPVVASRILKSLTYSTGRCAMGLWEHRWKCALLHLICPGFHCYTQTESYWVAMLLPKDIFKDWGRCRGVGEVRVRCWNLEEAPRENEWMNVWMCIYIPHISHDVSWRFTMLLSETERQLVKAPLAAAIRPFLISLTHPAHAWNVR